MNNVKHESRLIRPFLHAEDIKDLFAASSIRLKFGDQFSTVETQILRPEDVPLAKPAIFPAIDRRHIRRFTEEGRCNAFGREADRNSHIQRDEVERSH